MIKFIVRIISGIKAIIVGMLTVAKHIFRKPITLEYPEKNPVLNERFRGRPSLRINDDGSDVCIGCMSCTKVCPCGDLIQIDKEKTAQGKMQINEFTIDIGRCIMCGNCANVCPVNAIVMAKDYELADYSRKSLVYDKKRLINKGL